MSQYYQSVKPILGDVLKEFTYKGLSFPLYEPSLISIKNELENGGRVTTTPLYAFFGKRMMTKGQIREHVGLMIERREYQPPQTVMI